MLKGIRYCPTVLAFLLFFSSNACLAECAFASNEDSGEAQECHSPANHHESNKGSNNAEKEKHGAESSCCPALVAINISQNITIDISTEKTLSFYPLTHEKFVAENALLFRRNYEYPPGLSPPQIFLFSYTSHAPPIFL